MKKFIPFLLIAALYSCNSTIPRIFNKKTPHEKYAEKLEDSGLEKTIQGQQWLAASEIALQQPLNIELPFKLIGHFPTDKPRALGFRFRALRGEKLTFVLSRKSLDNAVVYADLYKENGTENKPSFLITSDTSGGELNYEIEETGSYILRLQPELFRTAEYDLVISTGPSLDFPVPGKKAKIGSIWGDDREGGNRKHEGIDIFAPKRTPVIAGSDGVVTAPMMMVLVGKQSGCV